MKYILLVLIIAYSVHAKAQPDQQPIPNYVLVGKSQLDLRLMRNEIFAKYGYIFKSDELREYFSQKVWYIPKYTNVDSLLTETDKSNIRLIKKFEMELEQNKYEPIFSDSTIASIHRFRDKSDGTIITKSKEVSFFQNYNLGRIKKVSEISEFGGEGMPSVIYAETIDPTKPYWSTTKYFNDLEFYTNYYKAMNYGCCGAEPYSEFYSYDSEIAFLKTNERFFIIEIPNSKLSLFIGYNHEIGDKETNLVAKLTLATTHQEINSIIFKTQSPADFDDIIAHFTPEINLVLKNPKDVIYDNKVTLWSNNYNKVIDNISGFSIIIEFIGDGTGRKQKYEIPIINGLLNGKAGEQTEIIELK